MSSQKLTLEELLRNNLNEDIEKLQNYKFEERQFLLASDIESLAICKLLYVETDDFISKCKDFNILDDALRNQLNKFFVLFKNNKNKKGLSELRTFAKELWELKYSYNISKLEELSKDKFNPKIRAEIVAFINDSLERSDSHKLLSNVRNYELILKFDPVVGNCIGYNAFSYKIVPIRDDLHWKSSALVKLNEWGELDDAALQNYINRTYENLNNEKILRNVIRKVANENSFHPVREYLENLPEWDKIKRAEWLFISILGADNSDYTKSITMHWLKAAIARVYYHGCKFDYCLVLKGAQGKGKSTVLAKLGGQWFNDSIFDINGKEALENLQGNWIIELGEMQAAKRADNEAIKAFISRRVDKFRLPYERRTEEFPRQCVFAGTTNLPEFLKDRTGGRRFWIVVCDDNFDTYKALANVDQNYIDQVWAEVLYNFNAEKTFDEKNLLPPNEILEQATLLQEEYTEGTATDGMVMAFLEMLIPEDIIWDNMDKQARRKYASTDGRGFHVTEGYGIYKDTIQDIPAGTRKRNIVCAAEIAYECFNVDDYNKARFTLKEINEILDRLPNWKMVGRRNCGKYGPQRKVYMRLKMKN